MRMKMLPTRSLLAAGLMLLGSSLFAHPGGHGHPLPKGAWAPGQRMWTRTTDGQAIEGSLLVVREGRAVFERPDGSVVVVPVAQLAQEDQELVAQREARIAQLNASLPTVSSRVADAHAAARSERPWVPLLYLGGFSAVVAVVGMVLQRKGHVQAGLVTLSAGSVIIALVACGGGSGAAAGGTSATPTGSGTVPANNPAQMTAAFAPFSSHVTTHFDSQWFYVESDGMPDHSMMTGITSWQQQVPTPQPYTGANAWQIPLQPVLASSPISAKTALYTGAIALAVNGVPIFNALNNRGDDAYLYGELDQWGGHAGRADDYHYHIAPLQDRKSVV